MQTTTALLIAGGLLLLNKKMQAGTSDKTVSTIPEVPVMPTQPKAVAPVVAPAKTLEDWMNDPSLWAPVITPTPKQSNDYFSVVGETTYQSGYPAYSLEDMAKYGTVGTVGNNQAGVVVSPGGNKAIGPGYWISEASFLRTSSLPLSESAKAIATTSQPIAEVPSTPQGDGTGIYGPEIQNVNIAPEDVAVQTPISGEAMPGSGQQTDLFGAGTSAGTGVYIDPGWLHIWSEPGALEG